MYIKTIYLTILNLSVEMKLHSLNWKFENVVLEKIGLQNQEVVSYTKRSRMTSVYTLSVGKYKDWENC